MCFMVVASFILSYCLCALGFMIFIFFVFYLEEENFYLRAIF
jgi:hypothetical protein